MKSSSGRPVVLVTAVGAPPGLNALRALVESQRYQIVACDAEASSAGLYQFGVPNEVVPLAVAEPEEYLRALQSVILKHGVQFVLPCIEGEVELLAERHGDIEVLGARVLLPDHRTVAGATDKFCATQAALKCGLPCPATILIPRGATPDQRLAAVKGFLAQCPPPWIVKPVRGHGMKNVETLLSVDVAMEYVKAVAHDVLLQEKIPGPVGSMHLVGLVYDSVGRVARRFSSRSIRTLYPGGGPATGGVSLVNETLVANTETLINSIGTWRGPANVEWMLDPRDGQFKFIEINPRLWGYGYLAVGAGTNFPVTTVELGLGHEVGSDPGFRAGVAMLRTTTDLIFEECPFELRH